MGRTALVIHPTLKEPVQHWLNPLPILKLAIITSNSALFSRRATRALRYPAWLQLRVALERYLNGLFGEAS